MKWPADRVAQSSPKSFGMYEESLELEAQGIDLIHLEVGRPDFDTPAPIKQATIAALQAGKVHYGEFSGELALREAAAARLREHNDLPVGPEHILITNGLTHAAFAVCMASLDPGDEVILLAPHYPQHVNKIELMGAKPVYAPLDAENGFCIDPAAIEACITPRSRMIALVNPTNPSGRVFRREELEALAELAKRHDLLVFSDEVYEQIVYDGNRHISIGALPGMFERTFSAFAFTKAYAMDGWRIGYMAVPERFMPALLKITMNDVAHVNVFIQDGALAALQEPPETVAAMVAEDQRRRDLVCGVLNQMPGISCAVPEGSIYAFPDIRGTGKSSAEIASALMHEAHVVTEAGSFYGPSGEGYLRVCFGSEPYDRVAEAMSRMSQYFISLLSRGAA